MRRGFFFGNSSWILLVCLPGDTRTTQRDAKTSAISNSSMACLVTRLSAFALLVGPGLILAGCSDSSDHPTYATSIKGYDKALTPTQQKAAITDLQNEASARKAEGADPADTQPISLKPAKGI